MHPYYDNYILYNLPVKNDKYLEHINDILYPLHRVYMDIDHLLDHIVYLLIPLDHNHML